MSDIDMRSYVYQLRRALPYVPPISMGQIKAMHRKGDLGGISRPFDEP